MASDYSSDSGHMREVGPVIAALAVSCQLSDGAVIGLLVWDLREQPESNARMHLMSLRHLPTNAFIIIAMSTPKPHLCRRYFIVENGMHAA